MHLIRCRMCDTDTAHTGKYFFTRAMSQHIDHDYLLMFFKTSFLYKDGNTFKRCDKNHYLLFPPHTNAEHGCGREGFVNDWIFFSGDAASAIIQQLALPLGTPFYIDDHSILGPYIHKIAAEHRLKHSCYEQQISATLTQMLVELGRQYALSQKTVSPAFDAINRAREYMLNHIEDPISVTELAARANYSASRFCVLYRRFFSVTPIEDLLNARIEKAICLLKYNQTSITETAALCGFTSLHYFSRKFKEKTGAPPSAYLK